ncbi:hypothetical protein CDEST_08662 [Colletotrichum destructivum]|uniref:Uncharacterized protein n=1 Tax=Colletotrichum destructivum TaxID=34406 RepID=A0AAX4ILL8_9PEZI|nr:hypothetical protein CDEST_08662 [Colletotrichum destructivum]
MPSRLPDSGPRERVTGGKHACRSIARHGRIRGWNLAHTVSRQRPVPRSISYLPVTCMTGK